MTQYKNSKLQTVFSETVNEAAKNLYWMNGLQVYLEHKNHPHYDRYMQIKTALLYGNPWAIQDLIMQEIKRGHFSLSDEFVRLLMNQHTGYGQLTHRKALQYISHCIDDEYIRLISSWSIKWQEKALLNEHFSRGQMESKLWMVDKLKEIFPNKNMGTVAHYGGWYATVAQHLFQYYNIKNYWNLEADLDCLKISEDFNRQQLANNWQFKSIGVDVNDIYWRKDRFFRCKAKNIEGKKIEVDIDPDLIINTSCEHMSEHWFEQIPEGKMICLQTNNYFSNLQHINCCENLEVALEKYPVQELYYSGQIETNNYTRYMIIGRK
jgi:hypothetical protein